MKSILNEYKIHNADVYLKEEVTTDDLVDVVECSEGKGRGVVYIPVLYVLNKIGKCVCADSPTPTRSLSFSPFSFG